MKKSTLIMILSLVLAVALGVGGTLAYLQDTDEDVNVMTLGSVYITQNEQEWNKDGTQLQEFTQDKPLFPAVGTLAWKNTEYENGAYRQLDMQNVVDKYVTVTNTGKSDAYVRTLIAFEMGDYYYDNPYDTEADDFDKLIGLNMNKADGAEFDFPGTWEWNYIGDYMMYVDDGYAIDYFAVFEVVHQDPIAPGETTIPSLNQVYLVSEATNENIETIDVNKNGKYDILVLSQAVQTQGFGSAKEALDTAFGPSVDNFQDWFENIGGNIGTPGDKWPNNNPPLKADVVVSSLEELKDALNEAKENGEPVVIDAKGIGVDLNDVTFPDGTVVMNLKVNGASNYGNGVNGTVTFINCEFVSGSTYAAHFDHGNTTNDQVVFQNCVLKGWNSFGTAIEGLTFDRCTFGNNGTYGIVRMYQSADFNNCTFEDDLEGVDIHEDCLNGTTVSFTDCEGLDVTDLRYNSTTDTKEKASFVIDGVDVSEQVGTW